jgi:hypothetical protein
LWLDFHRLRFTYRAAEPIFFPRGKPGNVLRGGFGAVLKRINPDAYARLFEPSPSPASPSGLREPTRLFVFRAGHLDGVRIEADETFHFHFHLFDTRHDTLNVLTSAFTEFGREGLGHTRGRAELAGVETEPVRIALEPAAESMPRLRVEFITPTELKSGGIAVAEPRFPVLLARARDRVSTLRSLNGDPPLEIDYRKLGEDAKRIAMTRCDITHIDVMRRSTSTGQRHPLGGFIGVADYEGELREFLPWLHAAQFTGVGRHTAWGQGEIRIVEPQ